MWLASAGLKRIGRLLLLVGDRLSGCPVVSVQIESISELLKAAIHLRFQRER